MEAEEDRLPSVFIVSLVQFFVGCILFVALLHGQRDLAVLALLVLALVNGAKLWSRMSLSGIKSYSKVDRRKVFPGEKISLTVNVDNSKFLPVWLQMKVPLKGLLHPSSCETTFTKDTGLLWYQRAHFQWGLVAQQRGVHQIGPPHITVGDLLGFFPREKQASEVLHIIVYPRLVPLKSFPLPRQDFFGVPGAKSALQDPIYFLGTRNYEHWQPAKYIHWKASARHSRLQAKIFEPTEQEKVLLLVEVDHFAANKAEEDFEHMLEIVGSLAVRLNRQGCAIGLATNGVVSGEGPSTLPIARNPDQLSAILETLARLKMESKDNLVDILRQRLGLPWGVSCAHFFYEGDMTTMAMEEYLTYRKIPMVFFTCGSRLGQSEYMQKVRSKVYHLDDISVTKLPTDHPLGDIPSG